jgi:hypothetical protein
MEVIFHIAEFALVIAHPSQPLPAAAGARASQSDQGGIA